MFNFKKMKSFFEEQGVKQKFIAQKTGIAEAALSLIMQGKRKCTIEEYVKICKFAGCSFDTFIDTENVENHEAKTGWMYSAEWKSPAIMQGLGER